MSMWMKCLQCGSDFLTDDQWNTEGLCVRCREAKHRKAREKQIAADANVKVKPNPDFIVSQDMQATGGRIRSEKIKTVTDRLDDGFAIMGEDSKG